MICDAHIHVGRYYRMTDAEAFDRSDFYYEPKVVADVLKRCGVDESSSRPSPASGTPRLPMSNAKLAKRRLRSAPALTRSTG